MFYVGQIVKVKDYLQDDWSEAIFIAEDKGHDYPFICASIADDQFHLCSFESSRWGYIKVGK